MAAANCASVLCAAGVSLAGLDLRGVQLKNCDLRDARLAGADLRGANLSLSDLRGVWRDRLTAVDGSGRDVTHDPHGGVPGAFPYENLVYIDFDGERYVQTSVVSSRRDPAVRTFEARRNGETLVFTTLGPGAPNIVGISPVRGHLWFVADDIDPAVWKAAATRAGGEAVTLP